MTEKTILIVEDDPVQRRQLARLLEDQGYKVQQAATGHETIRVLETGGINLILTDLKMPWMDGEWLVDYVRMNYPDIPIALATAYPDDITGLNVDGVLVKPFGRQQLMNLVHGLIGNHTNDAVT
jgi:CheY-like chemotaxis protein